MELTSTDFQCPDTGWGCILRYNEDTESLTAEVCETGIWTESSEGYDEGLVKETADWCRRFGNKHCETFEDACRIADKYDCWFN